MTWWNAMQCSKQDITKMIKKAKQIKLTDFDKDENQIRNTKKD